MAGDILDMAKKRDISGEYDYQLGNLSLSNMWVPKCALQTYGEDSYFYGTIYYDLKYFDTDAQEEEIPSMVSSIANNDIRPAISAAMQASGLLEGETGYDEKLEYESNRAVYDYLTQNVRYDNEHLKDEAYDIQYSAYSALHDKVTVCNGYALAYYLLAREVGLSGKVRLATSKVHAFISPV